jgi:hypothetical protein
VTLPRSPGPKEVRISDRGGLLELRTPGGRVLRQAVYATGSSADRRKARNWLVREALALGYLRIHGRWD